MKFELSVPFRGDIFRVELIFRWFLLARVHWFVGLEVYSWFLPALISSNRIRDVGRAFLVEKGS